MHHHSSSSSSSSTTSTVTMMMMMMMSLLVMSSSISILWMTTIMPFLNNNIVEANHNFHRYRPSVIVASNHHHHNTKSNILSRRGGSSSSSVTPTSTNNNNGNKENKDVNENSIVSPSNHTINDADIVPIVSNIAETNDVAHNVTTTATSNKDLNDIQPSNNTSEQSNKAEDDSEEECGIEIAKKKFGRKLRNRNSLNIKRKVTHAAFGMFFAICNQVMPRKYFLQFVGGSTTLTLFIELMRYRKGFGWMNHAMHYVLGSTLRKQEMEGKFTGSFYYFLGVTTTAYFFPGTPATLGIIQLALADPSASYFGRQTRHIYWSRIENGLGGFGRNKGVLGFIGGALFCVPFNFLILSAANWSALGMAVKPETVKLLAASLALGTAGAFSDLAVPTPALTMPSKVLGVKVPPFHVDDNFVVPIFSAYACREIFNYLGWSGLTLGKFIFKP